MAEMVASAVVGEAVSRISNVLIDKPEKRSSERDDMERLEMAHIKIEAALHMSDRWQIVDAPMLRWRSKLKRAAQECDDTLRHCKQRALEDEETRQPTSFPRRIARAAMSFMPSFSTGVDRGRSDTVRRFERFAEGTSEFLKLVEFGGRHYTFFNPLIADLLTGKNLRYQAVQVGKFYSLTVRPTSFAERGVEAIVRFVCNDLKEHAKSFSLALMMRLSVSTDIFGIIVKCLRSMAVVPHFMAAAEDVRRELIQLPSQDFSWAAHPPQCVKDSTDVHAALTQLFRPDPLCCTDHDSANCCTSTAASMYPEEVIVVYLQCHVSLVDEHQNRRSSATKNARWRRRSAANSGSAPLKLAILSIPHFSPKRTEPASNGGAYELIYGNGQGIVHRDACLQGVDKGLLHKTIQHLCGSSEFRVYLRPRHGSAYVCMDKMASRRAQSQSHDQCGKKNPLTMKLSEAFRAVEQMDTTTFCFFSASAFSLFSAAEQHSV